MNLLELLASRGLHPVQVSAAKGGEYACPCPGCGGRDRFHVFPEQAGGPRCQEAGVPGTYWCRKCGAGGDVLQYLLDFEGLDWAAACTALGAKSSRRLPGANRLPKAPRRPETQDFVPAVASVPPAAWRESAARLAERCHAALLAMPPALGWLARRGLDADAVRRYRLGYLAGEHGRPGIFRARSAWGLPDRAIKGPDGTVTRRRSIWMPRGIVIPAYGPAGTEEQPVRLRIRRRPADIEGDARLGKYYVVPGSGMAPMLLGPDRRAFVVVEAELDALLVHHVAGDVCGALAVLTCRGKPDAAAAAALARGFVLLCALDYDKAGASGWAWWRAHFPTARRWPTPVGKDPGDAYALGADLRAWILSGLPPLLRAASERPGPSRPASQRAGEGLAAPVRPEPSSPEPASPEPARLPPLTRELRARLELFRLYLRKSGGRCAAGVWIIPDVAPVQVGYWTPEINYGEEARRLSFSIPELAAIVAASSDPVITADNLLKPYGRMS